MERLPNETLDLVVSFVSFPIASFGPPDAARAACATLESLSRVSRRWRALACRVLEQAPCVVLPWTEAQMRSYSSVPRRPAVALYLVLNHHDAPPGDAPRPTIGKTLALIRGVERLALHAQNLGDSGILGAVLQSPTLRDITELSLLESDNVLTFWKDRRETKTSFAFRLATLSLPSMLSDTIGGVLLENSGSPLYTLACEIDVFRPGLAMLESLRTVRHLSLVVNAASRLSQCPSTLSPLLSLTSVTFLNPPSRHPHQWEMTPFLFSNTLATLAPTATLTHLSLPIGRLANLDALVQFLSHPNLDRLSTVELPNLQRKGIEAKGFGRAFVAACDARGVKVAFREELHGV